MFQAPPLSLFSRCAPALKLRPAIDWNTRTGNPARTVRCHKSDYVGDVFGFADSLQCLHSERELATRFCLRKIRHIRVNYSWCDSIDAYAARSENGGPILNQSLNCSFSRGVSEKRRIFQIGLARHRTGLGGRDSDDV